MQNIYNVMADTAHDALKKALTTNCDALEIPADMAMHLINEYEDALVRLHTKEDSFLVRLKKRFKK